MTAIELRPFLFSCVITAGLVMGLSISPKAADVHNDETSVAASTVAADVTECVDDLRTVNFPPKDALVVDMVSSSTCVRALR